MGDIKREFKGNLGMFLVCAELSKRNLIAMPTSRNTKGYDIVVLNPETNTAAAIQVKCTDRKDFPILSSHWRDYEEKIVADFVLVDISDSDKAKYFIVSDKDLKGILRSSIKKYASDYGKKHNQSWERMLDSEKTERRKPNLWAIKLSDIEAYEGKWGTITNRFQNPRH